MTGAVTDATHAPIAGANVRLTNIATNDTRELVTNAPGEYSFPALPAGAYSLSVTKSGFQTFTETGISVSTDQVARADVSLRVGNLTETIQVAAVRPGQSACVRG